MHLPNLVKFVTLKPLGAVLFTMDAMKDISLAESPIEELDDLVWLSKFALDALVRILNLNTLSVKKSTLIIVGKNVSQYKKSQQ